MQLIKKYILTYSVGGHMGSRSHNVQNGNAFVYSSNGFEITKRVFFDGKIDYLVEGNSIIKEEKLNLSTLDFDNINKINEQRRLKELNVILNADLKKVIKVMTDNEEGFKYYLNYYESQGLVKWESFLTIIKNFYIDSFYLSNDFNSIVKTMIKYGYKFESRKEAIRVIYKVKH